MGHRLGAGGLERGGDGEDLVDVELPDDPDEEPEFQQRTTRELLYRLRKQVPSVRSQPRRSGRRSMGTDIFS